MFAVLTMPRVNILMAQDSQIKIPIRGHLKTCFQKHHHCGLPYMGAGIHADDLRTSASATERVALQDEVINQFSAEK